MGLLVGGGCLLYILVSALRPVIGSVSMRSDYSICRDSSDFRERVYVINSITYGFLREFVGGLFNSGQASVPVLLSLPAEASVFSQLSIF
jgi:hypothetical protein